MHCPVLCVLFPTYAALRFVPNTSGSQVPCVRWVHFPLLFFGADVETGISLVADEVDTVSKRYNITRNNQPVLTFIRHTA